MNKKVSKTLAAVLSAAMAASAFAVSTGAAFAADNQISAKTVTTSIGITSNQSASQGVDLKTMVENLQPTFTVNGVDYAGGTIELDSTGWHTEANDTSLVTVDNTTNILKAGLGAADLQAPRTIVLTHTATATADEVGTDGTSKNHLTGLSVMVEVEVTVYPEGKYIILPSGNYDTGAAPASVITLSMNQGVDLDTYKINTDTQTGKASFTNISHTVSSTYNGNEHADYSMTSEANSQPFVGTAVSAYPTYDVMDYTSESSVVDIDESGKVSPQVPGE